MKEILKGKGIIYYENGDRYEGDFKSDKREGKGIYFGLMGIGMKGNLKKIKEKEKEFIILLMVKNMKEIIKMLKEMIKMIKKTIEENIIKRKIKNKYIFIIYINNTS